MTVRVEGLLIEGAKYLAAGLAAIVVWLAGGMLTDIKNNQLKFADAQYGIYVKLAGIEEKVSSGTTASVHLTTQVETLQMEVIDTRMRVNTLEARSAK